MNVFLPFLEPLEARSEELAALVESWARTSSWSLDPVGLAAQWELLADAFRPLGGEVERVEVPPWRPDDPFADPPEHALGPALRVRKRPEAPVRVLLGAHFDTVFPPGTGGAVAREGDVLRGPGAVDAKGGVAVLLAALGALEASPWAGRVGWEVLVTPDEEIGSPGSEALWLRASRECDLGLVFEPCLADGSLVGNRRGSGNFTVIVRGRAAHAGRNPEEGRNAVHGLADLIVAWKAIQGRGRGLTVNVAQVQGGGPLNVVPDFALFRANVRVASAADRQLFEEEAARAVAAVGWDGITVEVHGGFGRPPRTLDGTTLRLYDEVARCGREVGVDVRVGESGGASDANLLTDFGLPTLDGLGARGGGLHTDREFVLIPSLTERARLAARFLMGLGAGEIDVPKEAS